MEYKTKEPDHNFTHNEPPKLLIKRAATRSWEVKTQKKDPSPIKDPIHNTQGLNQTGSILETERIPKFSSIQTNTKIKSDPVHIGPGLNQTVHDTNVSIPNAIKNSKPLIDRDGFSSCKIGDESNNLNQTGSNMDSVTDDPLSNTLNGSYELKSDQNEPGLKQTLSAADSSKNNVLKNKQQIKHSKLLAYQISDTVFMTKEQIINQHLKWETDVTGIPQGLLRAEQVWDLPIDFMCYMHFFSHSFGRGRRWCNMGILDLQKFCGSTKTLAGKNTIRHTLDRLNIKKLIECIEPESPNQKSKKWLVRTPFEAGLCCTRESYFPLLTPPNSGPGLIRTGSNIISDGVKNEPGPGLKNTPTGSKTDTYKDNQTLLKDSLKHSLTQFLKPTQLSALQTRWMSFMKKEREREEKGLLKLFQEKPDEAELILKAFGLILKEQDEHGQIKSAISVLETNYTGQYRDKALAAIARKQERENQASTVAKEQTKKASEEDAQAKVHLIRTQCFEKAFPDLAIRKQYILNICKDNPMFIQLGEGSPIATGYAIMQWANGEGSPSVLEALEKETATNES